MTLMMALAALAASCANDPPPAPTPAPTATATVSPTPTPVPAPTATPTPSPTPTPTPTFVPTPILLPTVAVALETPTPTAAIPHDLQTTLDAIGLRTVGIRGLSPDRPVGRQLIGEAELTDAIAAELAERREELDAQSRLLALLGGIPPDTDLADIWLGVLSELERGYYDAESGALFSVSEGAEFTTRDELSFVHQHVHALQRQSFELADAKGNSDAATALRALLEGDAYLTTELLYRPQFMTRRQEDELAREYASVEMPALSAAPAVVQLAAVFPYTDGVRFAISLYNLTLGFDAIDAALAAPPHSTEQIIHPEKYGVEPPIEVSLPNLPAALGEGWRELSRDTMGEMLLRAVLVGELDAETASDAAAGWGGDVYLLIESPAGDDALLFASVWDTPEDADEFATALREYLQRALGGVWQERDASDAGEDTQTAAHRLETAQTAIELGVQSATVRLTIAPDSDALDMLSAALAEGVAISADE